jgi:phytoene dehydrogenase-like protein
LVRGGPGALSGALRTIIEQTGGRIRTDARVVHIAAKSGRISGVVLADGEKIAARAVVSAIDPRHTLLGLVDVEDLTPTWVERMRRFRTRGVTAKVNLALSGLPTFTALKGDAMPLRGRLLIAPGVEYLERAFDAAKYGEFSPAPWLEISLPSVVDSSLAPDGQHVMSIYVHFAPRILREASWAERRQALYRAVLGVLESHAPSMASLVVGGEIVTPEDLEESWGLSGGHIFHGEQTLDQSWIARPMLGWARYAMPVRGLYLASAGTHPGGGLTGGSGWLAGRTVAAELKRRS